MTLANRLPTQTRVPVPAEIQAADGKSRKSGLSSSWHFTRTVAIFMALRFFRQEF